MSSTIVVSIGNSDDKLTQAEWSQYQVEVHRTVGTHASVVHARCVSLQTDPWQNAVWVFEVADQVMGALRVRLREHASRWGQDSIALTIGSTFLLAP